MRSASAASLPPSYLVVDSQTGYVLIEQNAREKRQVASLTKIATACVVLDWAEKKGGDLNQVTTIRETAFVGVEKNEIGWQIGDVVSLRDLLYAALVQSDHLAANALCNRARSFQCKSYADDFVCCPNERPGKTTGDGSDAFRESQRLRLQGAADALLYRDRPRATHSLRDEQGELSLLCFTTRTRDFFQ